MAHDHNSTTPGSFRSLFRLVLLISLAIAAYFLISEHRAHILSGQWTAPILLIAFIGLHFLMHLGHGGHGGGGCGGGHFSRRDRKSSANEESDK
jgi:hypothetical protein